MSMVKDTAPTTGDQRVGDLVRSLRTQQHLSLRTLAARAGFSPSFISQVERGQASPSIASLERIANVLGVTLGSFFRPVRSPAVIRAADRAALVSAWSRAELATLGPTGPDRTLEPMMIRLAPGGQSSGRPFAHEGEEFAIVFEGEVLLTLGETMHRLGRGDAATFPAATPHRWENVTDQPAQIVVVSARGH
jgi:transcriptional regulator with XRE-family HTH domain